MKQFFELLTEINTLLEKFVEEKEAQELSLSAFALWLNREVLLQTEASDDEPAHPHRADTHITLLLNQLFKHYKLYAKKMLQHTDLVGIDDHVFLAKLYGTDSLRKMELVEANFVETSSGISVINRLLRKELLEEFDDPDDKRSKRVRLTDKGRTEYEATIPHILKVITIMAGGLTEAKKTQLASLLDELNTYHVARHKEAKGLTLDELLEQD